MELKYSARPAMFRANPLGFILCLLLCLVGIGLIIFLVWYLKTISVKLEVVGNDVILEEGLLSKTRTELDMSSVRTTKVYQSLFNRMFGVGTVSIYTAGDEPEIVIAGIPDPNGLRELIAASN